MASQRITDLMQSTASESEIKFYFITKTGTIDEASEDLKYSFQIIAEFASSTENLRWLSEADCLLFDVATLSKQNIFILEEFDGEAFKHLSSTKAIVLGPRILINCQSTNDVVPNIASPMYTLAMRNNVVCLSGIDVEKRTEIHKLVGYMGGLWTKGLVESTTHLITNTIKSPKYEKAGMRNMKIMTEDWINEVWNLSKKDDDSYTTEEFFRKYKMPIFHKLVITSTGIPEAEKNEIMKLINANGGTYTGSFKSRTTDILITEPKQRNSEKFKAAVKCRKECLSVDWVKDSISKGYALPFVNYRIYTGQATRENVVNSTQISNRSLRTDIFNLDPDSTQLSAIMSEYSIAETTSALSPKKNVSAKRSSHKRTLDSIDMSLVKHAMGCLDGCTIWLCGFDGTDIDKLKKIINIGGAIRIDEHGPDVGYAIVGKPNSAELTTLKSLENSNVVTVDWLAACINSMSIAEPKEFLYKLQASHSDSMQSVPSPASKKNIEAMNPFRRPDYVPRPLNLNDDDEKIRNRKEKTLLDQYAQPSESRMNVQREETGADTAEESEQIDPDLFRGLTFALFGFSEESTLEMKSELIEAGGSCVGMDDFSKTVDYLVVPGDTYDFSDCHYKAQETVTDLWVQECLGDNKIVALDYYHRAILLKRDCRPLQGLNIVFSTYTGPERDYLYSLARALGGEVNDRYMRNQCPVLICPTPDGKKYLGAIKWNLPVVSCQWLRQCLELETKVPMRPFVVGESKCDDDVNKNEQSGSDVNCQTQKFEKVKKIDERSNRKDVNEAVAKGVSEANVDENVAPMTPAQHPRISSIKINSNRQASPNSPKTPQQSNQAEMKTPITEFVEDLTPETRRLVYDLYKRFEENESPLSKRLRLDNVTDSPIDPRIMDPPDPFEIIDRAYLEMPKPPASTPFAEYRRRLYKEYLGDKYDGTPLRAPLGAQPNASSNAPTLPSGSNVDDADANTNDGKKKVGDGSTQVREFFDSIKRVRESRPSSTNTQQVSKFVLMPDSEEELPNAPPQQTEIIDWRDPDEYFQSERFLAGPRSTFKGTRCFAMSLAIDVEAHKLKKQLEDLGGKVCEESSEFDPSCTHLICSKPNLGEKTLSVIASGRWLLCLAYVEDSCKAGHFLNEEDYEWGNPKAKSKLPEMELDDVRSNNLASVSYKWRTELQLRSEKENKPVGIFSGFRVILHSNRKENFKRLLEAGCGVVVDLKEPYSEQKDFQAITHCFIDRKKPNISNADMAGLKKAGVHCVTMLYLQACLQSDSLPSVYEYVAK